MPLRTVLSPPGVSPRAIQLENNNGTFYYNLGLTYYDMGDREQASLARYPLLAHSPATRVRTGVAPRVS